MLVTDKLSFAYPGGPEILRDVSLMFEYGNVISKVKLNLYHQKKIGFMFQDYNLIPFMKGLENVMCGVTISTGESDSKKCLAYLENVGIPKEKAYQKITTLSGCEKQRVAIARALAGDKKIILADEPTGNLIGKRVLKL